MDAFRYLITVSLKLVDISADPGGSYRKIWVGGRGGGGGGVQRAFGNPHSISDQNMWFLPTPFQSRPKYSIPYFRPGPYPISFTYTFEKGFKFPHLSGDAWKLIKSSFSA